mmetsp:Transcript_15992/g.45897  ORF Transcript_15992/g.45897 Transcript_15992/m.45897 type:complete len:151 (+) Transcript_15992:545-997(+)
MRQEVQDRAWMGRTGTKAGRPVHPPVLRRQVEIRGPAQHSWGWRSQRGAVLHYRYRRRLLGSPMPTWAASEIAQMQTFFFGCVGGSMLTYMQIVDQQQRYDIQSDAERALTGPTNTAAGVTQPWGDKNEQIDSTSRKPPFLYRSERRARR